MRKTSILLLCGLLPLLFVQCKKDKLQPTPEIIQGITYADVQPIFATNCRCHMAGGSAIGKANLSTYASAIREDDLEESIRTDMYRYFNGDATLYSKVYSWIVGGYIEK